MINIRILILIAMARLKPSIFFLGTARLLYPIKLGIQSPTYFTRVLSLH